MINAIKSLHPLIVLVVSIIAFVFGGLWFSPLLFVKAWMAEVKMTPEKAKAAGWGKSRMAAAFFFTVVSTFALAALVAENGTTLLLNGAEIGLFVGAGLVGARAATTDLFEMRSVKYFLIVTGHDVAQFTLAGAILAVWR
jgi:sterol desaturase/sphingolipid hydroxylase (fatty acid hydroxylase superfamily)